MILQNLVLCPESAGFAASGMYYTGKAIEIRNSRCLEIDRGNTVDFETFFNAFPVSNWKKCTSISNLHLMLKGEGEILVRFGIHRLYQPKIFLSEESVSLLKDGVNLPMPFYQGLTDGLLFITVTALSDAKLVGGAFVCDDPVVNDVKLGMCITHFNRQKFVIPAAKRLTAEILEDPAYKGISLIIVDNSQNLKQEDVGERTILVPNRNTGGSGGFTRGLLELKDRGYTHCLFMDDDASCEAESVKRVFAFYTYYGGDEHIGFSGILMKDLKPWIVHEAGGYCKKGVNHQVNGEVNTLTKNGLLLLGQLNSKPNYGAWCFFGFRISDISHLSFPFFVRGDDVLFSQHNNLSVMTMLGVCTWIDSFLSKDNILVRYLVERAEFTLAIVLNQASPLYIYHLFKSANKANLSRMQYAQARGVYKALCDLMTKGTSLFSEDPDGSRFRSEIKKLPNEEIYQPVDGRVNLSYMMPKFNKDHGLHRMIRHVSLNGLLIPMFMFKHRVFWNKSMFPPLRSIYRFKEIYYFNDEQNTYWIAKHNKLEIIKGLWRNVMAFKLIMKNYRRVQQDFQKNIDYLTSEEYWRKVLGMNKDQK